MNKKIIWIITIIALLVVGGLVYNFSTSRSSVSVTNWKTYSSSQFGFSFQYPTDASLESGSLDQKNPSIQLNIDFGNPVTQGFTSKSIIRANYVSVSECYKYKSSETANFNGVTFRVGPGGDQGLGNNLGTRVYSTIHNEVCYEAALLITDGTKAVSSLDVEKADKYLLELLSTFKFTN